MLWGWRRCGRLHVSPVTWPTWAVVCDGAGAVAQCPVGEYGRASCVMCPAGSASNTTNRSASSCVPLVAWPVTSYTNIAGVGVTNVGGVSIADMNNDGFPDVFSIAGDSLRLHTSNGATSPTLTSRVIISNMNERCGDVVAHWAIRTAPRRGRALTSLSCVGILCGSYGVATGDMNGDGHRDVVACSFRYDKGTHCHWRRARCASLSGHSVYR